MKVNVLKMVKAQAELECLREMVMLFGECVPAGKIPQIPEGWDKKQHEKSNYVLDFDFVNQLNKSVSRVREVVRKAVENEYHALCTKYAEYTVDIDENPIPDKWK